MRYAICIVSLGWLCLIAAGAMGIAGLFGLLAGEGRVALAFLGSGVFTAFVAGAVLFTTRGHSKRSGRRELILTPVLCWTVVPLFTAVPFLLAMPEMPIVAAYFESVSGITTTGATIIEDLDSTPRTIILWRAFLQWLGGFGTIATIIPLFPILNIGGMSAFNNALPHGEGDAIGDRVRGAFRALWPVYGLITCACVIALWFVGVPTFEGLCLAMSTVSTGGFMPRNGSIGSYDNALVEVVLIPFMLLGAINFSLHWLYMHNRKFIYLKDPEVKRILRLGGAAAALLALALFFGVGAGFGVPLFESVRVGLFTAVSMITTTGFITGEEGMIPFSPALLVLPLIFLGGSTGSTAGGLKMMRLRILIKHGDREFSRLSHPHGVVRKTYAGRTIPDDVMASVWAFFIVLILTLCGSTLLLAASGLDLHAAVAAATAALSNTGSALTLLDSALNDYHTLPDASLWLLSLTMILGRLEVLPVLILLSPMFWRG